MNTLMASLLGSDPIWLLPAKTSMTVGALLLFAAVATFTGWMFYVQNAARKVNLSLELPGKLAAKK